MIICSFLSENDHGKMFVWITSAYYFALHTYVVRVNMRDWEKTSIYSFTRRSARCFLMCYSKNMDFVMLRYPGLFAFVAALLILFVLIGLLPRARFVLFLSCIALATGMILAAYFLQANVGEMLVMAMGCYLSTIASYLLSRLRRKAT